MQYVKEKRIQQFFNNALRHDVVILQKTVEETLIQGEYCVIHCAEGYWHDPERNTRICEKCEHDICPKTCYLDEPIDSSNIGDLKNCTLLEGFVEILRHPFEPHRKFFSDGRPPIDIEKLTVEMLEALSKVKIVTEYVNVQAADYSPESLSFLRSLTTIEGRKLPDQVALLVTSNHNLKELGLRSLKKIKNGRVYVGNNPKLCYLDTMKDYWKEIMQRDVTTDLKIINNQLQDVCEFIGKICDKTCDQNYGCWGEGPSMCVKCADYEMDDKCSAFCPSEGYYVAGEKCQRCQSECKTCNGPTTLNCTECLNIRIQQGNNWECLAKCPMTHYSHKNTCLPCNPACYNFGCTGPSAVVGEGGCNKCKYARRFDHGQQLMCLHTTGKPKDVCRDNNLTHYYAAASSNEMLVVEFECNECSEECLSCSGYGTSVYRHKCSCAHYLTKTTSGNEYCTMKCEMDSFMIRPKSLDILGECERCHELCDLSMGCTGRTTANCTRCAKAGVLLENQLVCLEQCPINHPFIASNKICHTLDPEEQASKRFKLCCLSIIGITVKYVKYKKRYKEELEMNLPSIPEYEPMDPSMRPNMTRLCIITSENLEKTQQSLGQGAFGTVFLVYCWLRNPESRPSFVILKEKFNQYCKAPHLYVLDHHYKQQFESVLFGNQHELTDEVMYNNEFPDQFKFSGITTSTTSTSVPPSPTTPCWVTFQQGDINMRQERRLGSTDSGRYQSDPVCDGRTELSMDEGNYLVPNNKLILYTPVVVRENGETELMEGAEYYNDKLGTDYYNQLRSLSQETKEEARSIKVATYQNDYYFAETETSL
ncbi:unnamed protein product [Onchocerca flexuosa]|uniref:Receptor protein-tyrosine kinase n=1 Tax=Onchocerca flexuosa TaxID=387005 RepID=A0A183I179_9BILA|nr:unnamed protein product [Onchocerca flexuosa]